jgi:hypothetical protein
MTTPIRVPPSGYFIQNTGGAELVFGSGARLRLTEAPSLIGDTNQIPGDPVVLGFALGSGAFAVGLTKPNPAYRYRISVKLDVINSNEGVGVCELYLETLSSDGITWTERASNSHTIAANTARSIDLVLPLTLGADLGIVADQVVLVARAKIGASSLPDTMIASSTATPGGDTKGVGTLLLTLEECF